MASPNLMNIPQYGLGNASWYTPGPGTIGAYGAQQEESLQHRSQMDDMLAQMDVMKRMETDPNDIAKSNLDGSIAKYLNTPENVGILGGGKLGEARKLDAAGREAEGMVPNNLAKAGMETEALMTLQKLNGKYNAISEALQNATAGGLSPGNPGWQQAISKAIQAFGFSEDSPEYKQAMAEWGAPNEQVIGMLKDVQSQIALQTQEHMRAMDMQRLKNRGALDVANANNKDDDNAARKDKIAMIRYYQTNIQEHRKGVRELEKAKAIAKGQAMLMYGHIKDPTERQTAIDSFLEEYDTAITGQWEEIRSLEEQLRGVDPNYKPGPGRIEKSIVPGQKKPRMETTDAGGGEAPQGDLRPVDKPNVTIKRGGSPSDSATASGKGPSASGKIRKGLTREERVKILTDERSNIIDDEYLTPEEKIMRLNSINGEIERVRSGRG